MLLEILYKHLEHFFDPTEFNPKLSPGDTGFNPESTKLPPKDMAIKVQEAGKILNGITAIPSELTLFFLSHLTHPTCQALWYQIILKGDLSDIDIRRLIMRIRKNNLQPMTDIPSAETLKQLTILLKN